MAEPKVASTPKLRNVEDLYPLTPVQEGMLFHTISDTGSGVYVEQILATFNGVLDVAAFEHAWAAVVARHGALRTAFVWDGLDEPVQVVRERVEIPWHEPPWGIDARTIDPSTLQEQLAELMADDRRIGLDLASAPLMRLRLWREADRSWRLLWTFHHLIADGWSARVVLDEVLTVYTASASPASAGLADAPRFRDFLQWLDTQDPAHHHDFWRGRLADFSEPTPLAQPIPPAPGGVAGSQVTRELDATSTDRVRTAATRRRLTLGTMVQAAWAIVASQWSRRREVVFGVTVTGRPSMLPGIEQAVGLYINTLPLRVEIDPDAPLDDFLEDVQRRLLELREHEHVPLADIQRLSGVPAGVALFDSIVVVENFARAASPDAERDLALTDLRFDEQSNYPLAVLVEPADELSITVVYDGGRYDERWAALLADQLLLVLDRLAQAEGCRVGELSLVSEHDDTLLDTWNHSAGDLAPERTIHELIERAARQSPDATAIIAGTERLSYLELDRRANDVARELRGQGVRDGDRVGISIERSPEMIIAILGVLKAGAAYVPLDPTYPAARNEALAADAGLKSVVVDVGTGEADSPPADAGRDPRSPAYVIYTSGSTGSPKGVAVSHHNLLHSTLARAEHYGPGPGRFLLLSSFAFDSSIVGIFWTLTTGGELVLPAAGEEQDMARLGVLIQRHDVTHLLALPSLYTLLLEDAAASLGSLRVVIVAGEACTPSTVASHFAVLPGTELHNEYGPTEATVWATVHRVEAADANGPVPIGRPIANTQVHVVDRQLRPVPVGFPGELLIGGPGVAEGYLHRPDLTAERFVVLDRFGPDRVYRTGDLVTHRHDGALLYLGRIDEQLKIRGHRIEAGEVEAALLDRDDVAEAAVVGADLGTGRTSLVAYVAGSVPIDEQVVRAALAARLPEVMVPSHIVVVESIPRMPNGKLDRRALPEPQGTRRDLPGREPRTEAERLLAALWGELLNRDNVAAEDDFFGVGGDSIVAIQLISRARHAGLHLEPRDIVDHPTLEALARAAADRAPAPDAVDDPIGEVPLGPMQHWFFGLDLAEPSHFNLSQLVEVSDGLDAAALAEALRACIALHPQLRARYERGDDGWAQTIGPAEATPPPRVEVVDDEASLFAVQGDLDIASGRLIGAALLRRPSPAPSLLLIAAHHLAIDFVSWAILMGDIEVAYTQLGEGGSVDLPAATTSYKRWVDGITEARPLRANGSFAVPTDLPVKGRGTEASSAFHDIELDVSTTRALEGEAQDGYQTTVEELVAIALAETLADWADADRVEIGLEAHGRPDDRDLSRTIGWFTTPRTVELRVDRSWDRDTTIKQLKEQLRTEPVENATTAGVNLNYLGRARLAGSSRRFRPIAGGDRNTSDPHNERTHALGVVAAIGEDHRFTARFHFSTEVHRVETIEAVASGFEANLASLIDFCCSPDHGGFTPSDFPEAGLDQAELDAFLDEIL